MRTSGSTCADDREAQPREHPRRVPLAPGVDELGQPAELDDRVELAARSHRGVIPEDRAVEVDVLAAGEVGMKAGADLDQGRADGRPTTRVPGVGTQDATQLLEQRALAGAVVADDPERFAALRPGSRRRAAPRTRAFRARPGPLGGREPATNQRRHQIPQRVEDLALLELLPQAVGFETITSSDIRCSPRTWARAGANTPG